MTAEECQAELVTREIPFTPEPSRGVLSGVRLTGPLHGVTFRTRESAEARATSTAKFPVGGVATIRALHITLIRAGIQTRGHLGTRASPRIP